MVSFLIIGFLLCSLGSFILYLIHEGRVLERVKWLERSEKQKNTYIENMDKIVQRSKEYDEKIKNEFAAGPHADRLMSLFESSSAETP